MTYDQQNIDGDTASNLISELKSHDQATNLALAAGGALLLAAMICLIYKKCCAKLPNNAVNPTGIRRYAGLGNPGDAMNPF
jgi:hypothetical protein